MNAGSTDLVEFFNGLEGHLQLFSQYKQEMDKYLSTDFNVIDYTPQDENTLSDIIADLLNPDGGHGQGNIFLLSFLDVLSDENIHNNSSLPGAVNIVQKIIRNRESPLAVDRERATANLSNSKRRMDIVIDCGDATVVLENKPYAIDQEAQLSDYVADARQRKSKYIIVYISGDGSVPSEASISTDQRETLIEQGLFFAISYSEHLVKWLERCIRESESEKLRWFLRDLISFIVNEFHSYNEDE